MLVELIENPDEDIAESDPPKAYVAKSMQLGAPLPRFEVVWGTVCSLYNDNTSGKVKIVIGNKEHKVRG